MMTKLKKLIPEYSWLPLFMVLIMNLLVYSPTQIFISDSARHYISMSIDDAIPFVPFMTLFYVLSYATWVVSWVLIGRESKPFCYRWSKAMLISKLVCLVCFIVYPTIIERPSLIVNDFFTWGLNIVWTVDKPVNCLPSIHALASWMAVRAAFAMKKPAGWYRVFAVVACILCFVSAVMTKQHYLIDIPAGMLAAEIGLFAARRTDDERFLWFR